MPSIVSITQQGQVTIPKAIRESLKIGKNAKAIVVEKNSTIIVEPIDDIFTLKGSIKPKRRPEDFKKMRKAFIDYLGKRALKKTLK